MEIRFKLKPRRFEAKHKSDIMGKILYMGVCTRWCSGGTKSTNYDCYVDTHGNKIVYSLQKQRRKIRQERLPTGKTKSHVIREASWVAYAYVIPAELPVSVKQHARHFELSTLK
jgi:hypothetical protein